MQKTERRWGDGCLVLSAVLAVVGCFKADRRLPDTFPVSGEVTVNGSPLEVALISFSPRERGKPAANGSVEHGKIIDVKTAGSAEGVALGEYDVAIYDDWVNPNTKNLVPDRYSRIGNGLTATVTSDGGNVFKFDLDVRQSDGRDRPVVP